jgi:hypothetical protein
MGRLPMFKKNERVYCVECGSWMAAPSGERVHGLRCASEGCESVLLPHESRQAAHAAMVGASTAEGEAQGAADGPAAPAPTTNKRKRVQEAHSQPTEPPRKKTVGVAWLAKRKKWQACIHWNGAPRDTIYLGYFDTEAAAAAVYKEARDAREAGQPLPPHLRKSKVKTSQYVGVSRMKNGNFTAVILHDGKQHHIGTYETEEQAKAAYDRVKAEIAATNTFTRDVKVASSAYRGVSFRASKGSWLASLQVDKKKTFCGWHKTEVEAAMAYDEAAKRHGLTHKLNFTTAAQVKVAAAAAAATTSASSSNSRSSPTVKRRRVLQPPAAAAATSLSAASAAYHEALGGGYQGGHTRGGYTRGFYHGGFQLL